MKLLKKSQSVFLLSPIIILALVVAGWKWVVHPLVINWVYSQIPEINRAQDVAEVQFTDLQISLLKLQAQAGPIEVKFKNDLKSLQTLKVDQLKIQVDPFELLIGQLRISAITLKRARLSLDEKDFQDKKERTAQQLPLDRLFKVLPEVPLDRIRFLDSEMAFQADSKNLKVQTQIKDILLRNFKNRIQIEIQRAEAKVSNEKSNPVTVTAQASALLTNENLVLNLLRVSSIESDFKIRGRLNHLKNITIRPQGELNIDMNILCDNVRTVFLSLFPQKSRVPALTGQVNGSGKISFDGVKNVNADFEVNTSQLSVDHFKFGKAKIKAAIKKNQLQIEGINIEHPAGVAELKHIEINQEKPYQFKTDLNVKSFNLQKLFVSLGLNSIPADLNLVGDATCAGVLTAPFNIECKAKTSISNVQVKPAASSTLNILKIKNAQVNGTVFLTDEDIQFESEIQMGSSAGSAKGVVNYQRGFKIDFLTNQLNFRDVEDLAGLSIAGVAGFKGSTYGTSSEGHIETDIQAQNAEIDDFVLGKFSTHLKYDDGHLIFEKVAGLLGQSDYQGDLHFNFKESNLEGRFKSAKLFADDVYLSLNKRFKLPFEFSGMGSGETNFSGPFSFWKLKYNLAAQFKHGQIAEEGFERATVNLNSDGNRIQFSDVSVKKVKSSADISGFIDTTDAKSPRLNLEVKTSQASLDEIDHFVRLLPTLTGTLSLKGLVNGTLDSPDVKIDFNTRQINIEGFDYPASQGQVGFNKNYFLLNGQVFGRQIQADVKWPWSEKNDYSLKLQVRDLNPLLLLPLISLPQTSSEFYSRVNVDVDLKGSDRTLARSTGTVKISDFILQRSSQVLKLKQPVTASVHQGLQKMDPIELVGDENHVSIRLNSSNRSDSSLDIVLKLKLRLLQFLVPFVDSLNGNVDAQAQMMLKSGPLQIYGDGQLSDGSILLKGFPTPIDSIRTPIEFSQSKIFLNNITARIGTSEIKGAGQVEIKGSKNVPVQLQAVADNLEITFPEKVTTSGRADLQFSGSWLPYNLKVNYKVNRGLFEKEFGDTDAKSASSLQGSHFLPPKQFESLTPSLLLDVAIDLSQGVTVKNQMVEGTAIGNLNVKGSPENPLLFGKIEIKPGSKIFFKDKPFEVQTATINFTQTNEINPDLYISALARVSEYDVNLLIQGPSKSPSIKPSSSPPLSENDIISLLALGITSTKMDQNLSSDAQREKTGFEVLAAISNKSVLNKKLQQTFGLNVQLTPSVDPTRNIAVPKVVVSKQLMKKLNASYSKPLAGEVDEHEIKLQYLFNPNWSAILNYQNRDNTYRSGTIQNNSNQNGQGVFGGDIEYKKEFKWK